MFVYRKLHINSRDSWRGDRLGGRIRLLIVLVSIVIFGSLMSVIFEDIDTQSIVASWVNRLGILGRLAVSIIYVFVFFWYRMRYYIFVGAAFIAAYAFCVRYVQEINNLSNFRDAFKYLNALVFAVSYPRMVIEEDENGKIKFDHDHLLSKVGGPGYLIIQPGVIVLLEGITGQPRVCAEGLNFVTRAEVIREITDLDDRQGFLEKTRIATTKDGIRICVRDINYGYRLRTGRTFSEKARMDPGAPYPFSFRAVLNLAYMRAVSADKQVAPWERAVRMAVSGAITGYIRERRFDDIASPSSGDPETRLNIARQLNSGMARNRLRGVGAELLWIDIGHFDVLDDRVDDQRLRTWGAKWSGSADVQRAYGDAKRISRLETGRAEAQAEIIDNILSTFDNIQALPKSKKDVQAFLLARTSQIIEGITQEGLLPDGSKDELPPP